MLAAERGTYQPSVESRAADVTSPAKTPASYYSAREQMNRIGAGSKAPDNRRITLGFVIAWGWAIVAGIPGIMMLFEGKTGAGICFILGALVVLPPANAYAEAHWRFALSGWLRLVIVITLTVVAGSLLGPSRQAGSSPEAQKSQGPPTAVQEPSSAVQGPLDQQAFIQAVESFYEPYRNGQNELQKSALRRERSRKVRELLPQLEVHDWQGVIDKMGTTSDGKAYVTIKLSGTDMVKLMTWNNGLSDLADNTLINQGDPLYNTLSNLTQGDTVTFTGQFVVDNFGDQDYPKEASVTEEGSMTDPDYLMRFSEIHPKR